MSNPHCFRNDIYFLKKWAIPGLFLFIFVFSIQLIINKLTKNVHYKFCQWLELNSGLLVSKETALPTEPQPLPYVNLSYRETMSNVAYLIKPKLPRFTFSSDTLNAKSSGYKRIYYWIDVSQLDTVPAGSFEQAAAID